MEGGSEVRFRGEAWRAVSAGVGSEGAGVAAVLRGGRGLESRPRPGRGRGGGCGWGGEGPVAFRRIHSLE
jgi:hypothetical protein